MKDIFHSSKFKRIGMYFWDVFINTFLMSYITPLLFRNLFLYILTMGGKGVVHGHVYLEGRKISIGKGSYINRNCNIYNANGSVVIGSNCAIAYNVSFHTTNHVYDSAIKRAGSVIGSLIFVEDGCWIGANAVILPGTIVHSGCVIAAGSIVKGECKGNSLYAGIPAKFIKPLPDS